MRHKARALILTVPALALAGLQSASAASRLGPVSVTLSRQPSIGGTVRVGFQPRGHLPNGGYYYAVVVLKEYARHSQGAPPQCAISSDMRRTQYAYPHGGRALSLTLKPASSASGHWCPGGSYVGAVYAVPHKPRCGGSQPCYGHSTQTGSCWQVEGRLLCGVVAIPTYSYPGGLPKPIDHSARVVGHFQVGFPGSPVGSGP
jgi:hypothetical protein